MKLKKGDHVRIQTEDPDSFLNGTWGIVQSSKRDEVMVAIEGLVTDANTLPFDVLELTKIEPSAANQSTPSTKTIDSSNYMGADRE